MALALDLTGSLPANKVNDEQRDVSLQVNRYIVPNKGAFYGKGLVIRNLANNQPLRPVVDYSLYEPVTDLWKQLGVGVYKIIHISNPLIAAVSIDYHAVGGQYQFTPQQLATELSGLLAGGDGTYPFGHVVGQPLAGLPPELHLEDGQEIYDAGKVVLALNQMSDVLMNGDRLALGHIYQYIDDLTNDAYTRALNEITAVRNRIDELMSTLDEGVGDIIITDNPVNPAVRKGYGQFQLNPDVLLIGANDQTDVGQLVGLKDGSDVFARRTFIWSQVENLGQVSYALAASATAIDEGEAVTFTLTTTGLTAGTRIPFRITGTAGFNVNDISPASLTGNFILDSNGVGIVVINAVNDITTEGNESFTLAITPVTNVSRTVTIRDTSRSPTITAKFTAAADGTGLITRCNEGDTVYLYVSGANLPLGHNFNIAYSGSAQGSDFTQPRVVNFTLDANGTIAIPFTLVNDQISDGDRTMIATITSSLITTPISAGIMIIDTSRTPEFAIWFSSDNFGANLITNVNEGGSFYLSGRLGNVAPGTQYAVIFTGTATYATDYAPVGWQGQQVPAASGGRYVVDFHSGNNPSSSQLPLLRKSVGLTVPDGEYPLYSVSNDFKTEGGETITAKLVALGDNSISPTVLASAVLTVNDTSQDASYDAGFYNNADGTGNKLTQCNEGQTIYFVLKTANLQPNERTLRIDVTNSTSPQDFTTSIPGSVTVPLSNTVAFAITVKNDYLTEGTEELRIVVSRLFTSNPDTYTQLAIASINILDTSVAPTVQVGWSKNTSFMDGTTSINEGETAYFMVSATNVAPNTVMNINLMQIAPFATEDDVVGSIPSQLTLNSTGFGYVSVTFKNDMKTEGAEKFTLNAYVDIAGTRYGEKATININDTSVPTASFLFSRGVGANEYPINSINEGESFYLIGHYNGYASGEVFDLTWEGANTWQDAPASTCTIDTNWSITSMSFAANQQTDGPRNLTAKIWKNGIQVGTAILTVNDTSVAPPPVPTYEFYTSANLYPDLLQSVQSFVNNTVVTPDLLDSWDNHVDLITSQYIVIAVKTTNVAAGTPLSLSAAVYAAIQLEIPGSNAIGSLSVGTDGSLYRTGAATGAMLLEVRPVNTGSGIGKVNANGWAAFLFYMNAPGGGICGPSYDSNTAKVRFNASTDAQVPTVLIQPSEVGHRGSDYRVLYSPGNVGVNSSANSYSTDVLLSTSSLSKGVRDENYRYIYLGTSRYTAFMNLSITSSGGAGASRQTSGGQGQPINFRYLKYDKYGAYKNTLPKRTLPIYKSDPNDNYADYTAAIMDMVAATGGSSNGNAGSGAWYRYWVPYRQADDSFILHEDDCVLVRMKVTAYETGYIGVSTTTSFALGGSLTNSYNNAGRGGANFSELNFGGGYGGSGGSGAYIACEISVARKRAAERLYLPPLVLTFNDYTDSDSWMTIATRASSVTGGVNPSVPSNLAAQTNGVGGLIRIMGWGGSGGFAD